MVKTTEILVRDMMAKLEPVKEDTPVDKMLSRLKKEGLVILPVVDKNNTLVGVVSEHDLIKLIKRESPSIAGTVWSDSIDGSVKDMSVKDIMSAKAITLSPNDTIDSALKVMNNSSMRVLPVTDSESKLLGVIRIRDVFEKLLGG